MALLPMLKDIVSLSYTYDCIIGCVLLNRILQKPHVRRETGCLFTKARYKDYNTHSSGDEYRVFGELAK